jgi:hypothetical protein
MAARLAVRTPGRRPAVRSLRSCAPLVLAVPFADKVHHDTGAIGFDRMPTRPGWRAEGQAPRKSDWKKPSANTHYSLAA